MDNAGFKFGGASYPLTASTTNSPLKDADPSLYFALDYLAAMINHFAGARMVAEFAKVGLKDEGRKPYTSAVGHKLGYDPGPYLTQEQVKFPLLAIWRVQDRFEEHTIAWNREYCDVNICYALPPLLPNQADRLVPMLKAVQAIVAQSIERGQDPTYTPPGSTLNGRVWEFAGIDRIQLMTSRWGLFESAKELVFPSWQGTIQIVERTDWVPSDYENFTGSDDQLDLQDPAGTTEHYVDLDIDV